MNEEITIWQGRFIATAVLNGSFEQKQSHIRGIVHEISSRFDELIESKIVTQENKALLFTNAILYANTYNVDTQELRLKIIAKGFEYLLK